MCDLEVRLGHSLKPHDPVLAWMVDYAAVMFNKHQPHESPMSIAYVALQGEYVEERLAYVCKTGVRSRGQKDAI